MRSIAISDSAADEAIRPKLIDLAPGAADEALAHLVPLGPLTAALREACLARGIEVARGEIGALALAGAGARLTLGDRRIAARLIIGADGAQSPSRTKAGIAAHGWTYGQSAIVATIRHELAHRGEAVQHFLPAGPFALLPLDEFRSSIVWSERAADVARLLAADSATQRREIAARAAGWRGAITAIEAIGAHPLRLMLARRFVGPRFALVADAAHVVHPLAGQGLNLGFEDVALLAELVVDRLRLGLDPGAPDVLEAYQAARRPAAVAMAIATDGINRLFSNDLGPVRLARDLGAGILWRLPGARARLMAAVSGTAAQAPRMFRGKAL